MAQLPLCLIFVSSLQLLRFEAETNHKRLTRGLEGQNFAVAKAVLITVQNSPDILRQP